MSYTPPSPSSEKDLKVAGPSSASSLVLTAEDEKRILRKLDLNVLPILSLLYLWSFLDRSNIGNAVLGGLKKDLSLTSTQLNIAISIFYASYVSWEAFSNIFLKKLRPSKYIPSLCLAWGLVTTLTCKVESFGGLVATRIFLGLTEAPLFPSICFIISMWYPRSTTCFRFALFFCSASLAGAFGGLLARGLMTIDTPGIAHWRAIYLVEGLITMAVAVLAFFLLKDDFDSAGFLTDEDKEKLRQWHLKDRPDESLAFSWHEVRDALKMPLTWVNGIQAVGVGLPIFSSASFFPSIVAGLGYSNTQAQLMTVPPYAFSAIAVILTGYFSDRLGKRAIFLQLTCAAGIVGYAIQLGTLKAGPRYFGLFLVAYSVYGGNSITSQWYGNNLVGHSRRATAQGFSVAFGNLAAIGGSYIYPANQGPAYHMGHGIAMGCLALAFTTATFQWWWFHRKNQELDRQAEAARLAGEETPSSFRFMV